MVVEKDTSLKLRLQYGDKEGSMTFSNVNPGAGDNRLMELAEAINFLQTKTMKILYKVEEARLVDEA